MKLLLVLMSGLEISDGVFTDYAAGKGMVKEGNPLMESIVTNGDFILLKAAGALFCALVLWAVHRRFPTAARAAAAGIILFYSGLMAWNAWVFHGV